MINGRHLSSHGLTIATTNGPTIPPWIDYRVDAKVILNRAGSTTGALSRGYPLGESISTTALTNTF